MKYRQHPATVIAQTATYNPTNSMDASTNGGRTRNYLAKRGYSSLQVLGTERGEHPMTTAAFTSRTSSEIVTIGIGGGAARLSSGYALGRILRSIPQLAESILKGRK